MKTLARLSVAAGFSAVSLTASLASAHVRLVYPTPRYPSPTGTDDSSNIKQPVCGRTGDSRTTDMSRITVLEPGATITVQFRETIDHPGFYRISFDNDGQDAFVAPTMRSQVQTAPPFTMPVLLDNIPDHAAGMYTATVTLPNVECERCTLQLIQVMVAASTTMWAASGADPDIYFTCADIALRRGGGTGGMGGMGTAGRAGAGGMPAGGTGTGGSAAGGFGGVAGTGGGVDFGGVGPGGAGGTGASAGTGTATGGAPTGGVTGGGAPSGGVTGTGGTATGGTATGAGAPAGGTAPNGGTTTFTPANTEEEGGCRMAPTSKGGHAFWATAALLALGVALRRRRGSRSVAA